MAGIGLTPCRSMAAENIRDLPRRAGHGRGLLRPAQRADSIDTHRQTPILDEVDDTSILKTGTQPRYPRSPSWLICTGASPQPPLSRSDLVPWHLAFAACTKLRRDRRYADIDRPPASIASEAYDPGCVKTLSGMTAPGILRPVVRC